MTIYMSEVQVKRLMARRLKLAEQKDKPKKKVNSNPVPEIPAFLIKGQRLECADNQLACFELEMTPPSVNNYWIETGKKGGKYLSHRAKHFRAVIQRFVDPVMYEGNIHVEIEYHLPDRRVRDADNIIKPILDALVIAKLFKDDVQAIKTSSTKLPIFKGGKVVIKVLKQEFET